MLRRLCVFVFAFIVFIPLPGIATAQQLSDTMSGRQPRFLIAASPRPIPLDVARTPVLGRSISLKLDGVPVKEALRQLSNESGLLLTYSDDVLPRKGKIVHIHADDITVAAALTNVLLDAGVDVVFSANGRAALVARPKGEALAGTVEGHVRDSHGEPIQGATVVVQGTQLASVTGADGAYRIPRVPNGNVTITARRLGYTPSSKSATIADGATVSLDFTLPASATNLGAIVVTGTTGNQTKMAQGALVAQVDANEVVSKAATPNVSEMLSARVPGVSATLGSGAIGQATRFFIRGGTSVALSNEPLVFIDGVRMYSDTRQPPGASSGMTSSALNDINPDDIKSIEVVKGPAAATLYGADASAGVIQIITKKGSVGARRATQSLSLEYNNSSPNFTPAANYGVCNAPYTSLPGILCSGKADGDIISDNYLERTGAFRNGHLGSVNYSIQGGGESYGYFLSGRADNQTGTNLNTFQNRRTGRGNFTEIVSPKLSFDASFSVERVNIALPQTDQSLYSYLLPAALYPAIAVPVNPDGTRGLGSLTPIEASENITSADKTLRTTPSLTTTYTPLAWFTNRLTVGADLSSVEGNNYYPRNNNGWYSNPVYGADLGYSAVSKDQRNIYTVDYAGTIKTSLFGNENITSDLAFGSQYINHSYNSLSGGASGFVTNASNLLGSAAQISSLDQGYSQQKSLGYYLVEQLGFHDQLFVTAGGRVDRNSSFGANSPSFFLPKASISYAISKASFWEPLLSVVPELHLRAAYGTTGRAPVPGSGLETYQSINYIGPNLQVASGVVPGRLGNPDLKAERGKELEAGLDAGLFDGKVGLELTYYDKRTSDLLFNVPLPPSLGFGVNGPLTNVGSVRNSGFEFNVNLIPFNRENFKWEATINGATLDSKVTSLGTAAPMVNNARTVREGLPIGGFWAQKVVSVDPATDVATVTDTAVYLGNPLPEFQGTLSTTFTLFKNIRIYTMFETKRDFKTYNIAQQFRDRSTAASAQVVLPADQGGYTPAERLYYLGNSSGQYVTQSGVTLSNAGVLGPYIQDADFVRWRELTATLSLPDRWAHSLHAGSASITVGGRNLHLWTKYQGPDPESLGFGPLLGSGFPQYFNVDLFVTPPTRDFIARLNLTF